ncbi:hypothetical protein VPNG_06850 [Cytospora leucostoma]|uniref:rRNA methyltransferase 2, mitochondrial n=1 Tax=Cytospora leucostoma TaxID=1230097 RepID=A0A423WVX1_9PEZI|nr:hypothetical protein VPNG_06850 [Cytospora leucostoma]
MQTILSAAPLRRRALTERLISRLLSQLTLTNTSTHNATTTIPTSIFPDSPFSTHKPTPSTRRQASTNSTWAARQARDPHARAAKVQGLKSRAGFKLLEIDARYKLFRNGQTVVDLGYAPGSWSQVAAERVGAGDDGRGRRGIVVGIDLIPAQPPRGVTSIQGDFLSPRVRGLVREVVGEQVRRRDGGGGGEGTLLDLCHAALTFASDTLKTGGHFVCKFYQGAEDKALQKKLQKMFEKVHREKPESSRSDSKEAYFVALRRKGDITLADVEGV